MGLAVLENTKGSALQLGDLPVIDAVLLSHEDHPDNLDEIGRLLLDGRRVLTSQDGALYLEEIPKLLEKYHVSVAILNVDAIEVAISDPPLLVTMDGKQAARLFREIRADVLVPMHYESWAHFAENGDQLRAVFEQEGISGQVRWLEPGAKTKIF
ncbi:hypothetical protein Landi51_11600 [Colletotrichum acutatum]